MDFKMFTAAHGVRMYHASISTDTIIIVHGGMEYGLIQYGRVDWRRIHNTTQGLALRFVAITTILAREALAQLHVQRRSAHRAPSACATKAVDFCHLALNWRLWQLKIPCTALVTLPFVSACAWRSVSWRCKNVILATGEGRAKLCYSMYMEVSWPNYQITP